MGFISLGRKFRFLFRAIKGLHGVGNMIFLLSGYFSISRMEGARMEDYGNCGSRDGVDLFRV